jgi:hypothetical protein
MRNAARLVIVALSALLLALPVSAAGAEPREDDQQYLVAGQPPSTPPVQPGATAPAGPTLEQPDTEADRAESRRKLVMGIASVVLIGIVVWGRSIKRKRAKSG